jgi:hypothetical protein
MSSTLISLCVSAMLSASSDGGGPAMAPPMKPEAAFVIDLNIISNLRKQLAEQRKWQEFRRTQLRRLRSLNEACLGSYQQLVEEAEQRLREIDRLVARTERSLRWWGVDPERSPQP